MTYQIEWETNSYGDTSVADIVKSLFSLCKYNNGYFKSEKQGNFIRKGKTLAHLWGNRDDKSFDNENFGVTVDEEETAIQFEGRIPFGSSRNGRGDRRMIYYFVMDEKGVKRYYKLGIEYYSGGSCIDPSKTKLVWERN